MTRFGRIVVTAVVAAVLIGVTLLGSHLLRGPRDGPAERPPAIIETPSGPVAEGKEPADQEAEARDEASAASDRERPDADAGKEAPAEEPSAEPARAGSGEAPAEPSGGADAAELARRALAMVRDHPVVAQKRLSEAVRAGLGGDLARRVHQALRTLAGRLQFSRTCHPGDRYSRLYTVQRGETLSAIGQRFLIPYPLVMKVNGLQTTSIRAGQTLKVIQGPVHLEVLKHRLELRAWLEDVCLRVYPVGLGINNSTPEGTFNVKNKIVDPPYQPQHKPRSAYRAAGAPDNPLGTRWIDLGNHYGIHGTIEPETIGREVSEGCIRMYNRHVEEVFDLVVRGASKVYIRP